MTTTFESLARARKLSALTEHLDGMVERAGFNAHTPAKAREVLHFLYDLNSAQWDTLATAAGVRTPGPTTREQLQGIYAARVDAMRKCGVCGDMTVAEVCDACEADRRTHDALRAAGIPVGGGVSLSVQS